MEGSRKKRHARHRQQTMHHQTCDVRFNFEMEFVDAVAIVSISFVSVNFNPLIVSYVCILGILFGHGMNVVHETLEALGCSSLVALSQFRSVECVSVCVASARVVCLFLLSSADICGLIEFRQTSNAPPSTRRVFLLSFGEETWPTAATALTIQPW